MKKIGLIIFALLCSSLFSQNSLKQNLITILGTTNVHGEIDPCG